MKNLCKIPLLALLLFAITVGPVSAQSSDATNVSLSDIPTNATSQKTGHSPSGAEDRDVRIDRTGVHVGRLGEVSSSSPEFSTGMPGGVVAIALVAIVSPFIFLIAIIYFHHRKNRHLHETLRAMIDKGVPIPPELVLPSGQTARRRAGNDLRSGLVIIGAGIGVVMMINRIGWIAIFVGIAFLITWFIEKKDTPNGTAGK